MKDLLIFGDSFGEEINATFPEKHPLYELAHKTLSYHSLLRESNKFKSVTTYAMGGSSLWSQFKLFKEKYTGNELVVWFITDPSRFVINSDDGEIRISGLQSAEYLLDESIRNKNNTNRTQLLRSAIDYIVYMQDREEDVFKHGKILDEIKNIVGDNLTFIDSFNFYQNQPYTLHNRYMEDNKILLGTTNLTDYHKIRVLYHDLRRNHMIEETHRLFAKELIKKIETGIEIDMTGNVKPNPKDFSKYFLKKN